MQVPQIKSSVNELLSGCSHANRNSESQDEYTPQIVQIPMAQQPKKVQIETNLWNWLIIYPSHRDGLPLN